MQTATIPIVPAGQAGAPGAQRTRRGQQAQGYLHEDQRPACANCWCYDRGAVRCSYGDFPAMPNAWCALWVPDAQWIDAHPQAATACGLAHQPEAAS